MWGELLLRQRVGLGVRLTPANYTLSRGLCRRRSFPVLRLTTLLPRRLLVGVLLPLGPRLLLVCLLLLLLYLVVCNPYPLCPGEWQLLASLPLRLMPRLNLPLLLLLRLLRLLPAFTLILRLRLPSALPLPRTLTNRRISIHLGWIGGAQGCG